MSTGVYVIYRDDLHLAYVGQSIRLRHRISHHRNSANAPAHRLFAEPGNAPRIEIHECRADELNDREYEMFGTVQGEGYELLNTLIRKDWPTPEQRKDMSAKGAAGLARNRLEDPALDERYRTSIGNSVKRHRAEDPVFDAAMRAQRSARGHALHAEIQTRRAADPEFDRQFREDRRARGQHAAKWEAERRAQDPEYDAQYRSRRRDLGRKLASRRRKCDECQMVTSPGNIGRHQRATGHRGFTELRESRGPEAPA